MPVQPKNRSNPPCHLIPPAEMFDRVLPGPLMLHADKPLEQRVEIAWRRLTAQFYEQEQSQMRKVLVDLISRDTNPESPEC